MSGDRRAHPRFPLVLAVQVLGAESARDDTENLSAGGLFIRTERDFAVGDRVALVVAFPQLPEPVELEVEVVRRRPGQGDLPAGVAVVVPPDCTESRERLAAIARRVAEASGSAEPSLRILVVEDNVLVASMYGTALRRLCETGELPGLAIESCSSGEEAVERLAREPKIHLLVTDVIMPGLSGIELVERVRGDDRLAGLPVVAITSSGEAERARLAELGVSAVLSKPVKYAVLAAHVRAILVAVMAAEHPG